MRRIIITDVDLLKQHRLALFIRPETRSFDHQRAEAFRNDSIRAAKQSKNLRPAM